MIDTYTHLDMNAGDPIADLESRMDTAGVGRALIVETWGRDNSACLDSLIASAPSRFRVALCFRPEEGERDPATLRSNVVVALRVRTADMQAFGADAPDFAASGRWLLPHAESGIGPLAKELVGLSQQHPSLKIFLPHLGWPRHNGEDDRDWYNAISTLSHLPNIVVGVSAIAHFSQRPFPHEDIEPFAAHLLGVFGANALVAASDYPLMEKSRYAEYMQLARDWTGWRSDRPSRLEFDLFPEGQS